MIISIRDTNIFVEVENNKTVSHAKKQLENKYDFSFDQIFIFDDFAFQRAPAPDSIEVENLVNPRIFIKPKECGRHASKQH